MTETCDFGNPAFHGITDLDKDHAVSRDEDIHTASEFNESEFFTAAQKGTGFGIANYFPGHFAGDLPNKNRALFSFVLAHDFCCIKRPTYNLLKR